MAVIRDRMESRCKRFTGRAILHPPLALRTIRSPSHVQPRYTLPSGTRACTMLKFRMLAERSTALHSGFTPEVA
jgi:hypothetical protein